MLATVCCISYSCSWFSLVLHCTASFTPAHLESQKFIQLFYKLCNRGMVHALPSGSTHKLQFENGMVCLRSKASQSKAPSSTLRSPQMLIHLILL
ncbi:hypothetical protein LguiA_033558 [Lonicera macranthoides]